MARHGSVCKAGVRYADSGEHMKVVVIGCGRVGSAVALNLRSSGWEVSVIDEREEALGRLGDGWSGEFHVGHGMDIPLLRRAGIEAADAVVVTTDGDNSNIVIGQIAQKQFDVRSVVVRVLDPARAEFFAARGLNVVCPTKNAIETLSAAVIEREPSLT
jgi:trk system potassium uptake protein TrkA